MDEAVVFVHGNQLGIRRAHLVLHDFGGPWGLTWAAQHRFLSALAGRPTPNA